MDLQKGKGFIKIMTLYFKKKISKMLTIYFGDGMVD